MNSKYKAEPDNRVSSLLIVVSGVCYIPGIQSSFYYRFIFPAHSLILEEVVHCGITGFPKDEAAIAFVHNAFSLASSPPTYHQHDNGMTLCIANYID